MMEKLTLRKYKSSDLDKHLKLLVMNKVYRKISFKAREVEEVWLRKVVESYKNPKPDFFVLRILLNKNLIGNVILEKIDLRKKCGHIGYWIGRKWQGKGFATSALNIFLRKIRTKFNIGKVYVETNIKNSASMRVLEKNKFNKLRRRSNKVYWGKRLR